MIDVLNTFLSTIARFSPEFSSTLNPKSKEAFPFFPPPQIVLKYEDLRRFDWRRKQEICEEANVPDALGTYSSESNVVTLSSKKIPCCANSYWLQTGKTMKIEDVVAKVYNIVLIHELIHWLMLTEVDIDWPMGNSRSKPLFKGDLLTDSTQHYNPTYPCARKKHEPEKIIKLPSNFNIRKYGTSPDKDEHHAFFNEGLAQLGTQLFLADVFKGNELVEYSYMFKWMADNQLTEYNISNFQPIIENLGINTFDKFLWYLCILRTVDTDKLHETYKKYWRYLCNLKMVAQDKRYYFPTQDIDILNELCQCLDNHKQWREITNFKEEFNDIYCELKNLNPDLDWEKQAGDWGF
jgi:hypothetical protein